MHYKCNIKTRKNMQMQLKTIRINDIINAKVQINVQLQYECMVECVDVSK